MKKNIFFASVLLVGLLISCSHDDSLSEEVVPQKVESPLNASARFVAQNVSYSTTFDRSYAFSNMSLSGNSTVKVSISNTGDVSANIYFSDSYGNYVGSVSVPKGGVYYTYQFSGVSCSGKLMATVTPSNSNGYNRVIGTMQASSW